MMAPIIWDHCSGCGSFRPGVLIAYIDGFNHPFAVCESDYPTRQPTVGDTRCITDYFNKIKNKEKETQ